MIVDNLAFLASQGKPPVPNPDVTLDIACVTAAPPFLQDGEKTLQAVREFRKTLVQNNVRIIEKPSDFSEPGLKVILGLQSPPEESTSRRLYNRLVELRQEGIRYMTVAYNQRNQFGGGFLCPTVSLTRSGKQLISMLSDLNIAVDLSHAGYATAKGVLEVLNRQPVLNSHTGVYDVYPQMRNQLAGILRGIADAGGIIGLFNLTFCLHQQDDTLAPFRKHLEALLEVVGEDRIAWGSDAVHQYRSVSEQEKSFRKLKNLLDPTGLVSARFPDMPTTLNSHRMSEVVQQEVSSYLRSNQVDKFMGLNALHFWKSVIT